MGRKASVATNNITTKPRRDRDWYPTPRKAVVPLVPYLPEYANFCEPCAGDGALAKHVSELTYTGVSCTRAYDVQPQHPAVEKRDATTLEPQDVLHCNLLITNPPFQWNMLKPLLDHLPTLKPTWLLLPFGYACNKRMAPYMSICKKVVPIGRIKWIEDSKQTSTDDFAWYLFDSDFVGTTKLHVRA